MSALLGLIIVFLGAAMFAAGQYIFATVTILSGLSILSNA